MPLSEEEQRILSEIEQQLYNSDPALVREVSQTTVYSHALRNIKWGVAGFLAGFVALVALLGVWFVFSFGGFLVMLASAVVIERNLRRIGRAGWEQLTKSRGGQRVWTVFDAQGRRMRRLFNREDGDL
ncbi:MAG: hypothetical protein KatS3mg008_0056 [Acidimicrobiales bacterium]|nr:MAG: hypothetical protein KatS3mg008_0056 [Acidimicrobiales bacterium]